MSLALDGMNLSHSQVLSFENLWEPFLNLEQRIEGCLQHDVHHDSDVLIHHSGTDTDTQIKYLSKYIEI